MTISFSICCNKIKEVYINIFLYNEVPEQIIINNRLFNKISFANRSVMQMLNKIRDVDSKEILNILNSINNQGLTDIDIRTYSYKRGDIELAFCDLSSAERLFLIAFAADRSKTEIYVDGEVQSLTMKTLRLFMDLFKYSKYVNIACNSINYKRLYENVKAGVYIW